MKLVFIRHGDPDYSIDSLTEKGWREAEMLAERIAPMDVTEYICSTMGRARDTASLTLKKAGRTAREYDWLREFGAISVDPDTGEERHIAWDLLPGYWTKQECFFDCSRWTQSEYVAQSTIAQGYEMVTTGLDTLLAEYGYTRDGRHYAADKGCDATLVFFCHLGVQCVMLSHLLGLPIMPLWHGFCSAPTGVTTLCTEERVKGIVQFRLLAFGDVSHLYSKGESPAFAGRFCEIYENYDERH